MTDLANNTALTPRVDLHTPKMFIIQFIQQKIIFIQFIQQKIIFIEFHASSVWRKRLSYNFHIWKLYDWHSFYGDTKNFPSNFENLSHKFVVFSYHCNCIELYEKKFPNYENCMINIFGQPGSLLIMICKLIMKAKTIS